MKSIIRAALVGVLVSGATGCEETATQQEEDIRDYFSDNRFGDSTDYMLSRSGVLYRGKRYGVIVLFGFVDNFAECKKLADAWNVKEPNTYECERLN